MPRVKANKPKPQVVFSTAAQAQGRDDLHIGWRYIHCAKHHFSGKPCNCPPGPQARTLTIPGEVCTEICCGGGRGSVKSESSFGWIMKGNDTPRMRPLKAGNRFGLPAGSPHPYDISYLNHPNFKFLVLRKTSRDLDDWKDRAIEVFQPFGVHARSDPGRLEFASGAKGYIGHWEDDAWKKWQGFEVVKLLLEEGGQIPSEEILLLLSASVRSPKDELVEQVMLTVNPGDVGNEWINARYRYDDKGNLREEGKVFKDEKTNDTRVFIHSTVFDNPYYTTFDENGERVKGADDYASRLERKYGNSEFLYKTWVLGDFDCVQGSYFPEFRKERMSDEPEWAYHVIPKDSVRLDHYWPRAIGLDWGHAHNSAVLWGCWHPEGRLYIYRELAIAGVSSMELGASIAKMSLPELEAMPTNHLTIFAAHDAFWRKDESLIADNIKRGIDEVLGRGAAFVYWKTTDEDQLPDKDAWMSVKNRYQQASHQVNITIRRANPDRVGGWGVIRDLLRWKRILPDAEEIDERTSAQIRLRHGVLAEREYRESFESQKNEILPKLRIYDSCPSLIRSVTGLIHDQKKLENALKKDGDDEADALRYLCAEFRFSEAEKPRNVWLHDEASKVLAKMPGLDTAGKCMMMQHLEAKWKKAHSGNSGFTFSRGVGRSRRRRSA